MDDVELVDRIVSLVAGSSGIAFEKYRPTMIQRRIEHTMRVVGAATHDAYFALLSRDPSERDRLRASLLIQTTSLFREPNVIDALRTRALPSLFRERAEEGASIVRAWVPGCSTGEEAFSLAMCLREAAAPYPALEVEVLATDVDEAALEQAASGEVASESVVNVPSDFTKWLHRGERTVSIDSEIRDMVRWDRLDLVSTPVMPARTVFASFDVVSCCNVLIYFNRPTQDQVVDRLIKSCGRGSLLILGRAERAPDGMVSLGPSLPMYVIE